MKNKKSRMVSRMNGTKMLMSITTIALLGAGVTNAQTVTNTNTQIGFGQRIMQSLTDAQKSVLDQARNLFQSGKQSEADALLKANNIEIPMKGKGHGGKHEVKGGKHMGDKKEIEAAIIAGNYAAFQTVASTSPLKSITQETFNQLVPQFTAKKAAEEQIRSILKTAGIEVPVKGIKTTTTN